MEPCQGVQFRWLGVAGVELRAGGRVLVIDPYFTRAPRRRLLLGRLRPDHALIAQKIERCDVLLATHAHFDHILDAPDVLHNTGAVALGSPNTCGLLAACGAPGRQLRQVQAGDEVRLCGFEVRVLPAQHIKLPGFGPGPLRPALQPPLRPRDYRMDDYYCFLVSVGGYRFLTDPGVRPQDLPPADVLFLNPNHDEASYAALLRQVQPRLVVSIHWDDFFLPLSEPLRPAIQSLVWPPLQRVDLDKFERVIQRLVPGTRVCRPEIFRVYALGELV